ncbi:MAG: hydantoinase/oxoprolinase N-terminal domain-containing protein, partial [Crocosphaera sp.]
MLKIFVDRGGTFTDIIALINDVEIINQLSQKTEQFLIVSLSKKQWIVVYKLLSENPERYQDAVIQGIKDILCLSANQPIPTEKIEVVKMGTTVATNALLE